MLGRFSIESSSRTHAWVCGVAREYRLTHAWVSASSLYLCLGFGIVPNSGRAVEACPPAPYLTVRSRLVLLRLLIGSTLDGSPPSLGSMLDVSPPFVPVRDSSKL